MTTKNSPIYQPPDIRKQMLIRRENIVRTIQFFEEDQDEAGAAAAQQALAELDTLITKLENVIIWEICPVCGSRFETTQSGPFVCPDCLAEEQADREHRAEMARPYLN